MKVRAIFRSHRPEPQQGTLRNNAPSISALFLSGLLHGALIAAAFLSASLFPSDPPKTLYSQLIAPEEKKIIWYPLRELRTITPMQRIGTDPVPQGKEKRKQAIISDNPDAKPGKQLLWRPDTPKKIERDIPAPNLVAVESPPAPAKPRNVFHLPDPTPSIEQPAETPAPPPVQTSGMPSKPAPALPGVLAAAPRVTRPFVAPPPPAVHRPAPELAVEPPSVQAGDPRVGVGNPANSALDSVLGKNPAPQRRQFVPPPAAKGAALASREVKLPELDGAPSAESVSAVVLSTTPLDKLLTSIPDGSRSAQMSGAPVQGSPASGPIKGAAGLHLPGVAVAGGTTPLGAPPNPAPKLPGPARTVYEESRNAVRRTSLSAPLRPSSRIVPQFIESRFHDRVAYNMIIVKPQLPIYAGDWVLWFAEKLPKAGNSPEMRAPQPVRKIAVMEEQPEASLSGRIQFAATILKNGQVDSVVVLRGPDNPGAQAAAIRDLQSWLFAPAIRDGQPVDVEVVVEIPFQSGANTISTGPSRH
jgi:TonB family protein